MSEQRLVDIQGVVLHQTDMAYFFRSDDAGAGEWLPMSQCEWDKGEQIMTMPEWLAVEKDLV
jgi:hypothetical protein